MTLIPLLLLLLMFNKNRSHLWKDQGTNLWPAYAEYLRTWSLTDFQRLAAFQTGTSANGGHWQWVGPSRDFYFPPSFSNHATPARHAHGPFFEHVRPEVDEVTDMEQPMGQYITRIP